ncbi:MAG: C-type lectin domain-containing protein [Cyanobacteria bacterium SBLK]|nr:C-type lectin domain-containing protein [Cyanobacteria bacterium SBLK]
MKRFLFKVVRAVLMVVLLLLATILPPIGTLTEGSALAQTAGFCSFSNGSRTFKFTNPNNGHDYCLTPFSNWDGAENFARSIGGDLVAIDDANEQNWLTRTFPRTAFWIGLTDLGSEGRFRWVNGTPLNFTFWFPGEPNGGFLQNAAIVTGFRGNWVDIEDRFSFQGVVEIPNQPITPITPPTRNQKFDVNDMAFLWPPPQTQLDANRLISLDERAADGFSQFWPLQSFNTVMSHARTSGVRDSRETVHITQLDFTPFNDPQNQIKQIHTWKIAGIRVDPSAPSIPGGTPQIRLIAHPVISTGFNRIQVLDYAAHLSYSFTRNGQPDMQKFREIVADLQTIKANLQARGVNTTGVPLGVHPGLNPGFIDSTTNQLRDFLRKHLSQDRLERVTFVGIKNSAEPWIFLSTIKQNGFFQAEPIPTLGTTLSPFAQMFFNFDPSGQRVQPLNPNPKNLNGFQGVDTSSLFFFDPPSANRFTSFRLQQIVPGTGVEFWEIPDIVANPKNANFSNTDCFSCHSESTRRSILQIGQIETRRGKSLHAYTRPIGISGVNAAFLPTSDWNVRAFGWFPAGGRTVATVVQRTANEAAEVVDFVNKQFLGFN